MLKIQHNYDNYLGIKAKIDSLPHFLNPTTSAGIGSIFQGVGGALKLPEFGLSELFGVGKANAQEIGPDVRGANVSFYDSPLGPSSATSQYRSANQPTQTNTAPTSGGSSGGSTSGSGDWGGYGSKNAYFQALGLGEIAPEGWNGPSGGPSDYEQQARNEINSGYDNYFNQLNSILNEGLPSQRAAQEGIAQSQYNQGLNTLTGQRDSSIQDLGVERERTEGRQSKTLKDIADNIRNSFTAGNVYLGARGAGDSSAANQYAYALTKLGSKQRGDVQGQYADIFNDIGGREQKVKQIYDTETKNLQEGLNQQISGIASWFAEQQNALRQAQAQGQLSKGQDLASLSQNMLNVALQQLQTVQQQAAQRRSALEEWAFNNSQNVSQLASNLRQISGAPFAQAPNAQPLTGTPQIGAGGSMYAPVGFGGTSNETDIFGRPLR